MKPFSIIVPVYNEEDILRNSVEVLVEYSDGLDVEYEIIAVSNGSTDASDAIGRELAQTHSAFKYFSITEKGIGRAFKKGIAEARHEHIVFLDADLSAELTFIEKANSALDDHVLVIGAKFKGLQNRSLFRKMGSFVFYISVVIVMGMKYVDYAPGAKGYRKSFLLECLGYIDNYTSLVLNLAFIAYSRKLPVIEIPIVCDDRRKSRFNLWQETYSKFRGLLSLKFKQVFRKL